MANEDFTTYTEVDAGGFLSQTASKSTFTLLTRVVGVYLYKDKTAGFFAGAFNHDLEFQITNIDSGASLWALTNFLEERQASITNSHHQVYFVFGGDQNIYLEENYGGTEYYTTVSNGTYSQSTTYYCRIVYDPGASANGTLYLYVFANATDRGNNANVLGSASLALHAALSHRYIMAPQSVNDGSGQDGSGFIENLDLSATPWSTAYSITCAQGSYTLSGQTLNMIQALRVSLDQGSYVLSGQDISMSVGHSIVADFGAYVLTGMDAIFTKTLNIVLDQGSYTLTGQDMTMTRAWMMALNTVYYTLTGFDLIFSGWLKRVKPSRGVYTARTKPAIGTYTKRTKPYR